MEIMVDGKLYDTTTSKEIMQNTIRDEWDSYYIFETLYQRKNGEFFICREMIGDIDDNNDDNNKRVRKVYEWVMDHSFERLTDEYAKNWIERYADAEIYNSLFGTPKKRYGARYGQQVREYRSFWWDSQL